jgi:decaprenylphospho-beta-D-erythro-pentofuranosid-2-ulose 2-reductase
MKDKNVLIIGSTSSLARAFAAELASNGANLILAARNLSEAEKIASDLNIRFGCTTSACKFMAENYDEHEGFFEGLTVKYGTIHGVFVSIGELGEQAEAQTKFSAAKTIIESNYLGVASILTYVGNYFERRKDGFIIVIGSVAGDRGRQSNYVYGSAKAALATFVQGLRNRLAKVNVLVLTVKPGFIDSKMTFGKQGMFLVSSPQTAAHAIYRALQRKKLIVYVPWFWAIIMLIIRSVPERLFVRLKL